MKSQQIAFVNSPLPLYLIILVVLLNLPTSSGDYDSYKAECSKLASCGKVENIGYPFWGVGGRPQECGFPDPVFELQCPGNRSDVYPFLRIDGVYHPSSFQVLSIDNHTMTIKLSEQHTEQDNCSSYAAALHLDEHSVHLSSGYMTINICKCDVKPGMQGHATTCSELETHAAYCIELPGEPRSDEDKCYEVPVLRKEWDAFMKAPRNETLGTILLKEFEVDFSWEFFQLCHDCQDSGGICSSTKRYFPFACRCKDRAYPHVCPNSGKWKLKLAIALPAAIVFLTALIAGFFWCKKRKFQPQTMLSRTMYYDRMRSDLEIGNSFFGIPVFSYTELQEATNNFDPDRILGDGGFGIVYLGKLRDGREVAVKRLYERNYKKVGQFMTEVEILTTLKHPNLVTLYGCTSRHSRELLLVYEYIPNGTVADHLYGDRAESTSLTWAIRMRIAIETAGALSYLHASDVIHRDVKTNNILLDSNFSVKVADFGLSRFFPLDVTHVSTAPQGTPGYLDPEYRKCYQVTNKSDVYSLGVVLVELISSMPAVDIDRNEDEINLSTYAMNKIRQGALDELVDQKLGFESDFKAKRMMTLVAELAFRCLQQEKDIRPSMEEVLEALKRIESLDYEALEAEEISRGSEILKPASGAAESEVEQPSRNPENPNSSPKSVIVGWASRSTVSNTSG